MNFQNFFMIDPSQVPPLFPNFRTMVVPDARVLSWSMISAVSTHYQRRLQKSQQRRTGTRRVSHIAMTSSRQTLKHNAPNWIRITVLEPPSAHVANTHRTHLPIPFLSLGKHTEPLYGLSAGGPE